MTGPTAPPTAEAVMPAALAARPAQRPAIVHPAVDFLCGGGLSIAVVTACLVYGVRDVTPGWTPVSLERIVWLNALINWPHFLASYGLLYGSRPRIRQHRWVALLLPALLVLGGGLAVGASAAGLEAGRVGVQLALVAATLLLAWHYTGQAWGMTAAFLFLQGVRTEPVERRRIRAGLRVLLVWHLVWGVAMSGFARRFGWQNDLDDLLLLGGIVALGTIPLGLSGFWRLRRRTGQWPSLCAVAPWAALYFWYALAFVAPALFFLVQLFHALQYLGFPMRVELNRVATSPRAAWWVGGCYGVLLVAGVIVFRGAESLAAHGAPGAEMALLIPAAISIHHYFIDGCIWKISNPQVRSTLFAHVRPANDTGR